MPTYSLHRDERAQKEWSILQDGEKAIPGVRFSTEREAKLVMKALEGGTMNKAAREAPVEVPNTPDKHESVNAVKGQEPRA